MADAADKEFVDYLHQHDVAKLIDEVLVYLAEDKPREPLSSILKAVVDRSRQQSEALGKELSGPGHDVRAAHEHLAYVHAAESLLELYPTPSLLADLERHVSSEPGAYPVLLHLALKLAQSRMLVRNAPPFHISLVIPLLDDLRRVQTREDSESGEGGVVFKLRQMNWLIHERSRDCSWEAVFVDAGSQDGTLDALSRVMKKEGGRLLHLKDALRQPVPGVTRERVDAADEMGLKGAAAAFGVSDALEQQHPAKRHVVVLATPSGSCDIAQLGMLLNPILTAGAPSALAQRFGAQSSVFCAEVDPKTGGVVRSSPRDLNVKLSLLGVFQSHLLPPLGALDFGGGMFAVGVEALKAVSPKWHPSRGDYLAELALQIILAHPMRKAVEPVGIAWVAPPPAPAPGSADDAEEVRKKGAEAFNTEVQRLADSHIGNAVVLRPWFTTDDADWGAFAKRLTPDALATLASRLGKVLAKDTLSLPEPSVLRLRLIDAQLLSKGDDLSDALPLYY
eukprot:Hpha_TRINITY_DN15915_c5_g2::TRINITY_DN15915_c5_g2_i2::g.73250::m.73250